MEKKILICVNRRLGPRQPSCAGRGAEQLAQRLEARLHERGLAISVERVPCLGECERGPSLRLAPAGPFIHHADTGDVEEVIEIAARFVLGTGTTR